MIKKATAVILVVISVFLPVLSQVNASNSPSQKDTIRNEVIRMGENRRRIKRLVLNDGTQLKGFLKEIRSESFVLVDSYKIVDSKVVAVDKHNMAREVRFDEVRDIKPYRSIGAGIVIGAIVAAVLVVIAVAASKD
jgi:hypothetical protein